MKNEEKELIEKIYKRLQTTMIGALARFENVFGYLWEEDSPQGDKYADMWEYTRNSILNNGNKQARGAVSDIGETFNHINHSIQNKYNYQFRIKNNQGDKNNEN